jgi:bifunctional oligoribonuclease and PAP phosphatase NrnA
MLSYFREIREKKVLITFHSLADIDAVGSAFALKNWFSKSCVVAPDTLNSRAKGLVRALNLALDEYDPPYEAIIILDTHSKRLLGKFAFEKADIIIDHHLKQDSVDAKHAIIDSSYSSTSEIVYFILKELGGITPVSASCLLAGIVSDSAGFKNANKRTFQAVYELIELSKIDYPSIIEIAEHAPDVSQRIAVLKAAQRCEIHKVGSFLVVSSTVNSSESIAAEALIELGADISFVAYSGEDARISSRMRLGLENKLNLAPIMSEAGKILGGDGGGHEMAAGANGPKIEELANALARCIEITKEKLRG